MALYRMFVPGQTVGASAVHWDLFHLAASGYTLKLESVVPVPSGAVAVTGVVSVDVFLTRTTAVGTGGTATTFEGTSLTALTICGHDTSELLNASILSARLTPSGGATAGAVLAQRSLFTEETSAGTYIQVADMVKPWSGAPSIPIPQGSGVRVVQSSVASVGVVGYDVTFSIARTR